MMDTLPGHAVRQPGLSHAATLQLQKFGKVPSLEFGKVAIGNCKSLLVKIDNPSSNAQELTLGKSVSDKGIQLHAAGNENNFVHWVVPSSDCIHLCVTWTPQRQGAVREVIPLLWDGKHRLQITVYGEGYPAPGNQRTLNLANSHTQPSGASEHACTSPVKNESLAALSSPMKSVSPLVDRSNTMAKQAPTSHQAATRLGITSSLRSSSLRLQGTSASMQSLKLARAGKLSFQASQDGQKAVKDAPSVRNSVQLFRHTDRPYKAAGAGLGAQRKSFTYLMKGMWMEKQERAYVAWLNHWLSGGDEQNAEADGTLANRRLVATLRGSMWRQYRSSAQLAETMFRIEKRIDEGRLKFRDEAVLKDVHAAEALVKVLLNYHPVWLQLALEAVTGQSMGCTLGTATKDILRSFVKFVFMQDKDLQDMPDVAVRMSQADSDLEVQLGHLLLKRFLLLTLLLDSVAQLPTTPKDAPLLFLTSSTLKASTQVVLAFLQGRLQGEGDLLRHLEHTGYRLTYEQCILLEYPYQVSSLAVDLRDGIRICRLAEILTGNSQLLEGVRFPSDKRPVQIYNTELGLEALRGAQVPLEAISTSKGMIALRPEDLVDGDRERTLGFLWQTVLHLQVPKLIRPSTLRIEIARIAASHTAKRATRKGPKLDTLNVYFTEEHISLLMQWVQAVCFLYDLRVHNFTSCFADGRALCLLTAHYLPSYLDPAQVYVPDARIEAQATKDQQEAADEALYSDEQMTNGGWTANFNPSGVVPAEIVDLHKQGMLRNFSLLHTATSALGSIPDMLVVEDFVQQGPDERAVILYTAFLCARLLEVSKEERAAHVIQTAWANFVAARTGSAKANLTRWVEAARVVQRAARSWLLRRAFARLREQQRLAVRGVVRLQAMWRGAMVRQELARQHAAVAVIQDAWRSHIAKKEAKYLADVVCIQAHWRGALARRRYGFMPCFLARCLEKDAELRLIRRQAKERAAAVVLQSQWRAYAQFCAYLEIRSRIIKIQATFRMALQRQQYLEQRSAVILIQRSYRRYASLKAAALVTQTSWRAVLAQRDLASRRVRVHSATAIQAAWRGYKARTELAVQTSAAVHIQSQWRAHRTRSNFVRSKAAATTMQAHIRRWRLQQQFRAVQEAAAVMQACWREQLARKELVQRRQVLNATITVQAAWRAHQVRKRLQEVSAAAVVIQAQWRMVTCRQQFAEAKAAAVLIQASTRGHQKRQAYQAQKAAAVLVQASWRSSMARQQYKQHTAARCIQRHVRGVLVRQELSKQRAAATCIQAAWRMAVQRRDYQARQRSAVLIQAAWRCHAAQQRFNTTWKATVTVQAVWRGHAARRDLAHQQQCATTIQAAWRRHKLQQQYQQVLHSIVLCQAAVRCHQQRRRYTQLQVAAITLQSHWQMVLAVRKLQQLKAAFVIQKWVKGHAVRQQLRRETAAAVRIQAAWRCCSQRRTFQREVQLVVFAQSLVRRKIGQSRFQAARAAAITIQSSWRRYAAQHQLVTAVQAAVTIQAAWRSWRQQRAFQREVQLVVFVQSLVRRKIAQCRFQAARAAAITIQSSWRRRAAQQQLAQAWSAAVTIQAAWRCIQQRRQYQQAAAAAVLIQAATRAYLARRQMHLQHAAAITLQAGVRGWAARKLLAWHRAAARIQAHVRGYNCRQILQQRRQAAVCIQAYWRRQVAVVRYHHSRQAAIRIQAATRGALARKACRQQVQASTAIQAAFRGHQARKLLHSHSAAQCIQKHFRGHTVRMQLRQQAAAATVVQARWRAYRQQQQFLRARAATVVVQAAVRSWLQRMSYLQAYGAVVCIQRAWRRHVAAVARRREAAAVVIQRAVKTRQATKRFTALRCAAVVLQSYTRGWLARQQLFWKRLAAQIADEERQRTRAAVCIQAHWRGHTAYRAYAPEWKANLRQKLVAQAALLLQRAFRGAQARKEASRRRQAKATIAKYLPLIRARCRLLRLQRAQRYEQELLATAEARQERAALVIQSYFRMSQERRAFLAVVRGIIRVQALWRGWIVRKRDGQRKKEARRKISAANQQAQKAPHKQLGVRAREALDVLLQSRNLTTALSAVESVELSTKYSQACCKLMVENGGISVLLRFVRSCNRSKPHVEMLKRVLSILAHVCRYPELVRGVFESEDCVSILSERLQLFRDIEEVFMPTLSVLRQMAKDASIAADIAAMGSIVKQWESIAQLLNRKMEMERKYISRLEGQKGSDVTAREATKKMISAASQLQALLSIITAVTTAGGLAAPLPDEDSSELLESPTGAIPLQELPGNQISVVMPRTMSSRSASTWQPKNTIARNTVKEIQHTNRHHA